MSKLLKFFLVWAIYVALHFAYKLAPISIFEILGCPEETIFSHMKMAFFSYCIINIVDILIKNRSRRSGVYPLLFSNTVIPYFIMILWYIVPVFTGLFENEVAEIIYSNIVLAISIAITIIFEVGIDKLRITASLQLISLIMFVISFLFYIALTIQGHPVDVFSSGLH